MNHTKIERVKLTAKNLKQQFLQSGTGTFTQVLGDQEIAAVMTELVVPYRERIYPRTSS